MSFDSETSSHDFKVEDEGFYEMGIETWLADGYITLGHQDIFLFWTIDFNSDLMVWMFWGDILTGKGSGMMLIYETCSESSELKLFDSGIWWIDFSVNQELTFAFGFMIMIGHFWLFCLYSFKGDLPILETNASFSFWILLFLAFCHKYKCSTVLCIYFEEGLMFGLNVFSIS